LASHRCPRRRSIARWSDIVFRKTYNAASLPCPSSLSLALDISFQYPTTCHVSRPIPKMHSQRAQTAARGGTISEGGASASSPSFTTRPVSPRDQFARIRPKSTISSGRGRTGGSVGWIEGLRGSARVSRALWGERGCFERAAILRDTRRGTAGGSLRFKLKGNSKYRPLVQSDGLAVASFPRPCLRLLSLIEFRALRPRSTPLVIYPFASAFSLSLSLSLSSAVSSAFFHEYLNFRN